MTPPEAKNADSVHEAPLPIGIRGRNPEATPYASDGFARAQPQAEAVAVFLPEIRLLVGLATAAVISAGLFYGREILIPLAMALLLGFVLDPVVTWFKRLGLPRIAAVVAVVALSLSSIVLAGIALSNQVSSLSRQLPTYQSNILSKLRTLRATTLGPGMFDGAVDTLKVVKEEVEKPAPDDAANSGQKRRADPPRAQRVRIEATPSTPFQNALAWGEASISRLATAGIVLVFLFLVLLDRDDLRDRLLRLLGGSLHRSTDAMDEAGRRISEYLTMQLVVNVTYAVPMAAGLWFIGVPSALLWGAPTHRSGTVERSARTARRGGAARTWCRCGGDVAERGDDATGPHRRNRHGRRLLGRTATSGRQDAHRGDA